MINKIKTCKHFNGTQNTECLAGFNIRKKTGGENLGWGKRLPCMNNNETTCEGYELKTAEEIAAEESAWEKHFEKIKIVVPLVNQLKKQFPEGGNGVYECPVCKGEFHFTISSYNGHASEGCVRLIE